MFITEHHCMPAGFDLDSNEFVISRYSKAHPNVEFLARVRNSAGLLNFEMRAPGDRSALEGLKKGLEARYPDVTIHDEGEPTMQYDLPVTALQGSLGPMLSGLAEKAETVFMRVAKGKFTFWFPDLEARGVQRTLSGRMGIAEAPEVSDGRPHAIPEWE